ncbi:hypothetical protein D3C73_1085540 [compost metagenome]
MARDERLIPDGLIDQFDHLKPRRERRPPSIGIRLHDGAPSSLVEAYQTIGPGPDGRLGKSNRAEAGPSLRLHDHRRSQASWEDRVGRSECDDQGARIRRLYLDDVAHSRADDRGAACRRG